MTQNLTYADRFKWFKEMQRQPKDILTADTKVVLGYLFAALDQDQDSKTVHYKTIAEGTGLTVDGVRRCMKRAQKAGFVMSSGKGGFVRNADAVSGLANTFSIQFPPGLVSTGDASTRAGHPLYPGSPSALPGLAIRSTRAHQHTNTSLSSSFIPTSSNSDDRFGMAGKQPSFEVMSLWGDFWPKKSEIVEHPSLPCTNERARARVVHFAFKVLGFELRPTGDEIPKWAAISEYLNGANLEALVARYRDGVLSFSDISTSLAADGIIPPAMDTGEQIAKAS